MAAALALAVSLLAASFAAEAQPAAEKIWRIGYLAYDPNPTNRVHDAFRDQLRKLGYVEGQNVTFEYRWATPDRGRFPALAAELAAIGVDVIVASGDAVLAVVSAPGCGIGLLAWPASVVSAPGVASVRVWQVTSS